MASFPPNEAYLQDTFVAVFTGPERPTALEQAAMEGKDEEAERQRSEMARRRLQKEVELAVSRTEFNDQARYLQATNYVYAEANFRKDLADALPAGREVPLCLTACARFVQVNPDEEDIKQAGGPATSTTAGEEEAAAAAAGDAAELVK